MSEAKPTSVADRLAAELAEDADAELVDGGSFDIDADRALDKLGRFQLAEPRAHVLRLCEAGLIAGAERLVFEVSHRELRASFLGPEVAVIPGRVLERLLSVLIGRDPTQGEGSEGVPREMLVQLAIAVIAKLRAKPLELSVASVGRDGHGWRQVFAGRGRAVLEEVQGGDPGVHVHLIDPGRDAKGERDLLLEHARHLETELILDGHPVSGYPAFAGAMNTGPIRDGEGDVIGELGFFDSSEPGRVELLSHGLLIETVRGVGLRPGGVARVECRLPRDLSRSKFARGSEFDALVKAVRAAEAELWPEVELSLDEARECDRDAYKAARIKAIVAQLFAVAAFVSFITSERDSVDTSVFAAIVIALSVIVFVYYKVRAASLNPDRDPTEPKIKIKF